MSKSMNCPVCNQVAELTKYGGYSKIESHHRIAFMLNGVPQEMTCEGSYRIDYEGYNG